MEEEEAEQEKEALRLKAMAESKFKTSKLTSALKYAKRAQRLLPQLDGISEMVTSLDILTVASKSSTPDWYKILKVEPFSHPNIIRKQYKKLALILHPDKNPHVGSEEAFKLVSEAFRFLSDKIRRKEYDMKLRIRIQEEVIEGSKQELETFWTACCTCRLLHQFERKYLGHNLVCPSCRKSFKAVEVGNGEESEEEEEVRVRNRSRKLKVERLRKKVGAVGKVSNEEVEPVSSESGRLKDEVGGVEVRNGNRSRKFKVESLRKKVGTVGKSRTVKGKVSGDEVVEPVTPKNGRLKDKVGGFEVRNGGLESEGAIGEWSGGRLRSGGLKRKMSTVGDVLERSKPKKIRTLEETMTLAEMQSEIKKKAQQERKMTLKVKEKEGDKREKSKEQEELQKASRSSRGLVVVKPKSLKSGKRVVEEKQASLAKSKELKTKRHIDSRGGDMENMEVEDSDFYDFDKDRVERSFKKGQVWAVYDDDDGMPRNYALIDEVVSVNPFDVRISWLDLQNSGDEKMIGWEKRGFHISCGRFKVARKTSINSVNIFSHVVDCEHAAREVYIIYPKKGSVWALYDEAAPGVEGRNVAVQSKRRYDIVVFLTSYSEITGSSMAYLGKVKGYKTIFKRQEVGSHAIRFLERDDFWSVSHQIPARKFSGSETPELLRDSWELDPASLPADLLGLNEAEKLLIGC